MSDQTVALSARIDDLEFKLAFQEETIVEIRDHLLTLHAQVQELKLENRELMRRLKESGGSNIAGSDEETLPPHY